VCSNVHGHNLAWQVSLVLEDPSPPDNMTVDFKVVSDYIDKVDHATLLNDADPLITGDVVYVESAQFDTISYKEIDHEILGDTIVFDGDPTCEVLSD